MRQLRLLAAAGLCVLGTPAAYASELSVTNPSAAQTLPASKSKLAEPDPSSVQTRITYTTAAGVAANRTNGSYTGVGTLFIEFQSTSVSGLGSICTGSLLARNVVVTAAHCLADRPGDAVVGVTMFFPSLGEAGADDIFLASTWQINPGYNGNATRGGDFGLLTLGEFVNGRDVYEIHTGDPGGEFTRVGTGTVGGPAGTGTGGVVQDYSQRSGQNLYEYLGTLVTGWGSDVLLSDFDDGTAAHDVFGRLLGPGAAQTGIVGEANSSGGDSGGPNFIDGRIVAVTSFGITGDAFGATPGCGGPTSIDPYFSATSCTNSSIGEMSGDTWLRPHLSFINSYLAAAVPEPGTWAMMILGFGAIGGMMRRSARERAPGVA